MVNKLFIVVYNQMQTIILVLIYFILIHLPLYLFQLYLWFSKHVIHSKFLPLRGLELCHMHSSSMARTFFFG